MNLELSKSLHEAMVRKFKIGNLYKPGVHIKMVGKALEDAGLLKLTPDGYKITLDGFGYLAEYGVA